MKLIFLTLAALAASVSGAPSESRIIGGTTTVTAADAYFVVAIADVSTGDHICSGWIYAQKWIVTTAKCVAGRTVSNLKVTVGMTNQLRPGQNQTDYTPLSIKSHPSFNSSSLLNDIAMLEMPNMVFSDSVYYVFYDEEDGLAAQIMGWGATVENGLPSLRLRKADLDMATDCATYYGASNYDARYMMCAKKSAAGTNPGSPCQYDEGSPLTQSFPSLTNPAVPEVRVTGMFSKTLTCSDTSTTPAVFTRMASYFSWMKSIAGVQPLPSTTPPPTSTVPTAPCNPSPCPVG